MHRVLRGVIQRSNSLRRVILGERGSYSRVVEEGHNVPPGRVILYTPFPQMALISSFQFQACLGELVLLKIFDKHQQGLTRGRDQQNAKVATFTLLYQGNFMRVTGGLPIS